MKYQSLRAALSVAAAALLVAGCGGGGGGSGDSTQSLQVTGTAASGKALANASVEVRCAAGSGTATTTSSGGYTVTIENGKLPCLVKVSGTSGGATIVLHSAVESGSTAGNRTTATANVTPITELVLAQLLAALPEDVFATYAPGNITASNLAAAAKAVVDALKTAGIDLGSTDAFKADLVAAHDSTAGNAYDQLLDVLASKIPAQSLPMVANQIAAGAASHATTGLDQAIAAVTGGTLANCPYAVSGNYRTIDYAGRSGVRKVDFKKGQFFAFNGTDSYAITADASNACQFSATGTVGGVTSTFDVVIGASGVGSYKVQTSANQQTIGYIFPVQSHALSEIDGTWSFLQSGTIGTTVNHYPGEYTFNAGVGTASKCDYDTTSWLCVPENSSFTIAARTDGGFDVFAGTTTAAINLWAYRAPSGSTALFGTTNAAGSSTALQQTNIVATRKLDKLALPAVASTTSYWDTQMSGIGTSVSTSAPVAHVTTIDTVDAGSSTVTRTRDDGRQDVVHYNKPIDGVRSRDASSSFAAAYMMGLTGMGVNVSVDIPASNSRFYVISVTRP